MKKPKKQWNSMKSNEKCLKSIEQHWETIKISKKTMKKQWQAMINI